MVSGVPTSTLSRNRKHYFPRVKRTTSENIQMLCRYDAKHEFVRCSYQFGIVFPLKYHVKMHMQAMSNQLDRTIDFGRVFVAILFPIQAPFGSIWAPLGLHSGSIGHPMGTFGPQFRSFLTLVELTWATLGPT